MERSSIGWARDHSFVRPSGQYPCKDLGRVADHGVLRQRQDRVLLGHVDHLAGAANILRRLPNRKE